MRVEEKTSRENTKPEDWRAWLEQNRSERMDPNSGLFPPVRAGLHLARYRIASRWAGRGFVLDVSSGTGYGSKILAASAAGVVGVDISHTACRYAGEHYRAENVSFVTADGSLAPFPSEAFDAVVSIETLEHLADDTGFLREVQRVLKPSGRFIASVPRDFSPNSYHFRGYTPGAFFRLLSHFFSVEKVLELDPRPRPPYEPRPRPVSKRRTGECLMALAVKRDREPGEGIAGRDKVVLSLPTSPVHVRHLKRLQERLPGYVFIAINPEPVMPQLIGIKETLARHGIHHFDATPEVETALFALNPSVVLFCAAFDPYALKLFREAKLRGIPTVAMEEVAQLALNDCLLNSYTFPFDTLATANSMETELFVRMGRERSTLVATGVLSFEGAAAGEEKSPDEIKRGLGIPPGKRLILYTTSPLRSRKHPHSFETEKNRRTVLEYLRAALGEDDRLVVKLHPNEPVEENRRLIRSYVPDALVFSYDADVQELIRACDLLINRGNSQTALEAVLFDRPLLLVPQGITNALIEEPALLKAGSEEDFVALYKRLIAGGAPDYGEIKARYFVFPLEETSPRLADAIREARHRPLTAEVAFDLALQFIDYGKLTDYSLDMALRAAALDPGNPVYSLYARALRAKLEERLEESAGLFGELLPLMPEAYQLRWEAAEVLAGLKRYEDALFMAREAQRLLPMTNRSYRLMVLKELEGEILYRLDREHELERLIEAFEKDHHFIADRLLGYLIKLDLSRNRPEVALGHLDMIEDLGQRLSSSYAIADHFRELRRPDEALAVLDRLPDHPIKWAKMVRVNLQAMRFFAAAPLAVRYISARFKEVRNDAS